jgi:hypothetical protein
MPIAAINSACHCSLFAFILIGVGLVILTGIRAWLRRDRTIHGARLALRFGVAWSAAVVAIGVTLWVHGRGSGPLHRPQLARQADSICNDDVSARLAGLESADPASDPIPVIDRADNQALDNLRQLTPTSDIARDWRRFVNGFAANVRSPEHGADPGRATEAKGRRAATRLGIDCTVF